jgi:hypothetical protein
MKKDCISVSLVHVKVDDYNARHVIELQEREISCHGDVAEDAKAFSSVIEGVVSPTSEVRSHGHLAATHAAHCRHRAAH